MQVGGVQVDVGELDVVEAAVRNAPTISSSPAQIRDTSDFVIPDGAPRASTRSSTERVDTPLT